MNGGDAASLADQAVEMLTDCGYSLDDIDRFIMRRPARMGFSKEQFLRYSDLTRDRRDRGYWDLVGKDIILFNDDFYPSFVPLYLDCEPCVPGRGEAPGGRRIPDGIEAAMASAGIADSDIERVCLNVDEYPVMRMIRLSPDQFVHPSEALKDLIDGSDIAVFAGAHIIVKDAFSHPHVVDLRSPDAPDDIEGLLEDIRWGSSLPSVIDGHCAAQGALEPLSIVPDVS